MKSRPVCVPCGQTDGRTNRQTTRQTDGQTDTTKLTVALRNLANAPNDSQMDLSATHDDYKL
jgi:hypothetical protein